MAQSGIINHVLSLYSQRVNRASKIKFTTNAINGCLGDFDRGKTQTAAILVGEVPSTFDPAVSEWGNLHVSDMRP